MNTISIKQELNIAESNSHGRNLKRRKTGFATVKITDKLLSYSLQKTNPSNLSKSENINSINNLKKPIALLKRPFPLLASLTSKNLSNNSNKLIDGLITLNRKSMYNNKNFTQLNKETSNFNTKTLKSPLRHALILPKTPKIIKPANILTINFEDNYARNAYKINYNYKTKQIDEDKYKEHVNRIKRREQLIKSQMQNYTRNAITTRREKRHFTDLCLDTIESIELREINDSPMKTCYTSRSTKYSIRNVFLTGIKNSIKCDN